ncbi:MAG: S-layer protein, partial [Euryarchaeota archaeon]|nr:S-layer protein [Euryarchaeota archaeon]
NEDYYYTKKVGSVSDLPIIAVHFEKVFRGREVNAVFIRGVFQISESYTQVKSGNKHGAMKIDSVNSSLIKMVNDNTIDLSSGSTSGVMGNIKFKVADSRDLRFYPFVMVTSEMIANQLVIDAPAKANAGDNITIKVTAGGSAVDDASISINSEIGKTDRNGVLDYTLPKTMKGMYNITAAKLGYEKATKSMDVAAYIEYRLSIEAPATADQFETIAIKVTYNSTAISGAALKFDNTTIGETDSNGVLNYTLQLSGTHTITASKSGYITAVRDIDIKMPFSEYKALDLNITPSVVFTNEEALIKSNITNVGTKKDTLPVELVQNGTVVDNRTVSLAPGEITEVNFTRKEALPGNYTVELLGQKGLLEVKKKPLNLLLIGGIATGFGAVIIYLLTAKSKISIEAIRKLFGKFGKKGAEKITSPGEGKV